MRFLIILLILLSESAYSLSVKWNTRVEEIEKREPAYEVDIYQNGWGRNRVTETLWSNNALVFVFEKSIESVFPGFFLDVGTCNNGKSFTLMFSPHSPSGDKHLSVVGGDGLCDRFSYRHDQDNNNAVVISVDFRFLYSTYFRISKEHFDIKSDETGTWRTDEFTVSTQNVRRIFVTASEEMNLHHNKSSQELKRGVKTAFSGPASQFAKNTFGDATFYLSGRTNKFGLHSYTVNFEAEYL